VTRTLTLLVAAGPTRRPHFIGDVPEHVLLDLTGGGLGQLGAEDDGSGHHVQRHALPAPGDDVAHGHRAHRAVLDALERARRLAPELVRPRHDRRLVHRRVALEHGLDLDAADVSPALMITSLHRSRISRYPSGCTTPTSPV
jgi:hypothetical protein